ncbi:simple sugar transport system permease protein [Desulfohalotomaculum tongense]|uniref:ABC transporter permease n=1 Tax=Desulforadius tongensis TaxID=1216062 RepID=UPI00195EED0E|nr:ABC transporter permease [Desulforadius tongensis]MBM7855913.1 simple sugar transport system permease protein [Desulforadius tongensis]
MNSPLTLEKRISTSAAASLVVPAVSVLLALATGAVFLWLAGHNPVQAYTAMFKGGFGSLYGLSETVVKAIPLMICALGISLAFRMQLWNIGAEGQLYMGAFGATWVALTFPDAPAVALLPAMFIMGVLCGGIWGILPAIPRAYLGVNEIITTLMLNYVAVLWVDYLVYGPWKDPNGFNFPLTAQFSPNATLPAFGDTRIHAGLLFAAAIAVLIHYGIKRTRWGYEIRVIGVSQSAARYAGMNIPKNIMLVMLLSGAVCGLAGMAEVSGLTGRLQHGFSPGYGYTAIIIAWLAKLHPLSIIIVSILFGGLQAGGFSLQSSGVPAAMVSMLQGAILFFVLGGEILTRYRIVFNNKTKKMGGKGTWKQA